MAATRMRSLLGHIEQLSGGSRSLHGTDCQLLEDFAVRQDETAFAELVARHGPMVLRVCRRVLRHEQDAEDAFQATFLVLAQSHETIRKREALADWLHGVAYRIAMKAKRSAARRRNHEAQLRPQTPTATARPTWDDVQAVLDEEIQRLPQTYRSAFVLCVLEGKTLAVAAAELGCKEGTVSSRLTRARQRLQRRLARRGIELTALFAALCVAEGIGQAAVSIALAQKVVRSGVLLASGATAAGLMSPQVAALVTSVTRAMLWQKAKIALVVMLTVGLFAAGAGALTQQLFKAEEEVAAKPPVRPSTEPAKPKEDTIEVMGRVLDPDGNPVAKARLYQPCEYSQKPWWEGYDAVSLGVTDGEGRFRVQLRRVSLLSRRLLQLLASADGFGLNWINLPKDEKPDEVTLRLVQDQVVRGRLVNTEGKPVVGVTLHIHGVRSPLADMLIWFRHDTGTKAMPPGLYAALNKVVRVSATDKDGRFEIAGLGAERMVWAEVQGDAANSPVFIIATREGFDPKPLLAELRREGRQPICKLWYGPSFECVVLPTRSLEGMVREAGTGKPVVGAAVVVQTPNASSIIKEAVTDANGHYRLNGLSKTDNYRLSVSAGKTSPLLPRDVQVADDRPGLETIRCDVELNRGAIVTGRVLDKATGKGIMSKVTWVPLPDNPFVAKDPNRNVNYVAVQTDSEGRFRFVTIPGPAVMLADVSGIMHNLVSTPINPYKQAEFDETDRKRVKVEKSPDVGVRYFRRADGGWVGLDSNNACKVVDLKEDTNVSNLDLTVDPGQTRSLQLEDPDGRPLPGVTASRIGATPYSTGLLKTATCPVLALDADHPRQLAFLHKERKLFALVTVHSDRKEPLTIRLAPTGVITGRLLDARGQPLADAKVHLDYSEAAAKEVDLEVLDGQDDGLGPRTDKEGRFRMEVVFPGVKFKLSSSKGRDAFVEMTEREPIKAGATLDLGDICMKPRNQ